MKEKGILCPNCGQFTMELVPGYLGKEDAYVCSSCHHSEPLEDKGVALDRDSLQRFPAGADAAPTSQLSDFLAKKGKKL